MTVLITVLSLSGLSCGDSETSDDDSTSADSDDDDDTEFDDDDFAADDDLDDDDNDTSDDDSDDDDTFDDDTVDDDDDDGQSLPLTCEDGGIFHNGDVTIRQLAHYWFGQDDTAMVYRPQDGRIYIAAATSREVMLYSRSADAAAEEAWQAQFVDCMAKYPDMAVDADGYLHIVYADIWNDTVAYATNRTDNGGWIKEVVDTVGPLGDLPDTSYSPSDTRPLRLALDSQGRAHVVYNHWDTGEFRHAERTAPGVWAIETIQFPGEFLGEELYYGMRAEIAVDANDRVHVVYYYWYAGAWEYYDYGFYAVKSDSEWEISVLRSLFKHGIEQSHFAVLTKDPDGDVVVTFVDDKGRLWTARSVDGKVEYEPFATFKGSTYRLLYDSVGEQHLFHLGGTLSHYTYDGNEWVKESVDVDSSAAYGASILMTPDDKIHYVAQGKFDAYYASNQSGEWENLVVHGKIGRTGSPVIALDGSTPHLVFQRGSEVVHWTLEDGKPVERIIADFGNPYYTFSVGPRALGVDAGGVVHLVYVELEQNSPYEPELTYATFKNGEWNVTKFGIDGLRNFLRAQLILDDADKVHIVTPAYGNGEASIAVIEKDAGEWVAHTTPFDGGNNRLSMAYDAQGTLHIVSGEQHTTPEKRGIFHTSNESGAWETAEKDAVVTGDDIDLVADIAADSTGLMHIAYNAERGPVYVASGTTGRWSAEEIEGRCSSPRIAIEADDTMHVLCDGGPMRLSTKNDSDVWESVVLDPVGVSGSSLNFAFDPSGAAQVAYIASNGVYYLTAPR
ncbi:MAG: hypothetical protein H6683_03870 [Deltaproteobacteria bacterium]|nr:hypothetical protein [Deltaproteobacteria bacterium]